MSNNPLYDYIISYFEGSGVAAIEGYSAPEPGSFARHPPYLRVTSTVLLTVFFGGRVGLGVIAIAPDEIFFRLNTVDSLEEKFGNLMDTRSLGGSDFVGKIDLTSEEEVKKFKDFLEFVKTKKWTKLDLINPTWYV